MRIVTAKSKPCFLQNSIFAYQRNDTLSIKKGSLVSFPFLNTGAGEESRTLDLNLGKVALYQLSYSRINEEAQL
jgi:hypothetical protein